MARPKSTGRFETRDELVDDVWSRWLHTKSTQSDIAVACKVSVGTVSKIIDSKEGYARHLASLT